MLTKVNSAGERGNALCFAGISAALETRSAFLDSGQGTLRGGDDHRTDLCPDAHGGLKLAKFLFQKRAFLFEVAQTARAARTSGGPVFFGAVRHNG